MTEYSPHANASESDKKISSQSFEGKANPSLSGGAKSQTKLPKKITNTDLTQLDPSELYDHTLYNHLEGNFHLSNKKALFYNMKNLCEHTNEDLWEYLPQTFHVKDGVTDKEFIRFEKYYKSLEEKVENDPDSKIQNTWIVKPGENTNRGSGIQYCTEFSEIKSIISKRVYLPSTGKARSYIIQKYLDNPFLYNKRKFDIR